MLPLERQNRIKQLITENQSMKISDLSAILNVSEMTVHRDVKPLIEDGLVIKTFGGITISEKEANVKNEDGKCVFCRRDVNERMAYRLILPNNQIEVACCAHCGLLRHQQLGDKVIQAICPDFLRQTTISAKVAWYVMDTTIHMGCCHPQVLTFEWKEHAFNFVKGFGGNVYDFQKALEVVNQKMSGNAPCCSSEQH